MNFIWRSEAEIIIFGKRFGFKTGPDGDGSFPLINIAGEICGCGVKMKITVGTE